MRLFYLVELSNQPGFSVPMVDEKWHWLWAQEILDKSFWGEGSYFRGPLYPYLLAFLYFITDASIFWAKFLQILICGLTAAFIFKIGRGLFNETVGIISGFASAFYGTFVFCENCKYLQTNPKNPRWLLLPGLSFRTFVRYQQVGLRRNSPNNDSPTMP